MTKHKRKSTRTPSPDLNKKVKAKMKKTDYNEQHEYNYESDNSGVISDDCISMPMTANQRNASSSNLDGFDCSNEISSLPNNSDPSFSKLYVTSLDPNIKLTRLNPILFKKCLVNLVGEIKNINFLRNGNLFITCPTIVQSQLLLTEEIEINGRKIGIKFQVAKHEKSIQGKIFAPNLIDADPKDILLELKEQKAIKFEKLLKDNDPEKSKIPLFLITFSGTTFPEYVEVAFCRFKVERFIPNPYRCNNCCKWGHTRGMCKATVSTCGKCGEKGHTASSCSSPTNKCLYCSKQHPTFSKECQRTIDEKAIYEIKFTEGISYFAAKEKYLNPQRFQNPQLSSLPQTLNLQHFPNLKNNITTNEPISDSIPSNQTAWFQKKSLFNPRMSIQTQDSSSPETAYQKSCSNLNYQTTQCAPNTFEPIHHHHSSQLHNLSQPSVHHSTQPSLHYSSQLHASSNSASHLHASNHALLYPPSRHLANQISNSQNDTLTHNPILENKTSEKTLINLLTPLIPIFIKLLFSDSLNSRKQCLMELGTALNMGGLIKDALSEQNIPLNNESENSSVEH